MDFLGTAFRLRDRALTFFPAAFLLVAGAASVWTADDGFIVHRVVANLLDGHGPVFNVGERIEAVTSPLWLTLVALVAAPVRRVLEIEWVAAVLGVSCSSAALFVISRWIASRSKREPTEVAVTVPAGPIVIAALPPFWDFASGGLEGGLGLLWLATSFIACAEVPTRRRTALLAGLGPLVRPDFALFSATWALVLLRSHRRSGRRSQSIVKAALFATPVLAFEVFRMGYYGCLVPTTALAKEAFGLHVRSGANYILNFVEPYWLFVPLLACVLASAARPTRWTSASVVRVAFAAAGVAHLIWVVVMGGDFMHARLLLPATFAIAAPTTLVVEPRRWLSRAAVVTIGLWCIVCASALRPAVFDGKGPTWERRFWAQSVQVPRPVTARDWNESVLARDGQFLGALADAGGGVVLPAPNLVRERGLPTRGFSGELLRASSDGKERESLPVVSAPSRSGSVVAYRYNMGVGPFVAGSKVHVVDAQGLTDPIGSRIRIDRRAGRPGHEKELPVAWLLARFTPPRTGEDPEIAAAREALRCPELDELLASVTAPMDVARFIRNVGASWRLTRLRIARDVGLARAELCGGAIQSFPPRSDPDWRAHSRVALPAEFLSRASLPIGTLPLQQAP